MRTEISCGPQVKACFSLIFSTNTNCANMAYRFFRSEKYFASLRHENIDTQLAFIYLQNAAASGSVGEGGTRLLHVGAVRYDDFTMLSPRALAA